MDDISILRSSGDISCQFPVYREAFGTGNMFAFIAFIK